VSDVASVIARAAAAEGGPPALPLTLELRSRRQALHAAIAEALDGEGTAGHEAACARVRRLWQEFEGLAAEVWLRPVAGWADVTMRAEVALAYHQAVDGAVEGLQASCPFERSLAELLKAVAALNGDQ
jgi:hypothetical protein